MVAAGLGVGCGLGIGFGQPLNFGAVPAVGQAIAGMGNGLGQVSGFLGGAGTGVQEVVRRLGVKGLDAGLGCGVGVGYGFGAGLFLKPSAAEQLVRFVEDTAGNLARHAQAKLQQVGLQLPGGIQPLPPPPQQQQQAPPHSQELTQQLLPVGGGSGNPDGSSASTSTSTSPSSSGHAAVREPSAEEFRALLRHERQISRLRAHNRALRSAVCKLDRRLPLCKEKSDDGDGSGGSGAW